MRNLDQLELLDIQQSGGLIFGLRPFQAAMVLAALCVGLLEAILVPSHSLLSFIVGVFTVMAAYEFFPKYPVISLSCVLMLGGFTILLA